MRILASNPDNLGDLILRQPMYAALVADGHELALVVREFAAPLARLLVPQAARLVLDTNPYDPSFSAELPAVVRLLADARAFNPDLFCIAPYQRTAFDELLSRSLDGCTIVAMNGSLFSGHIDAGLERESDLRATRIVEVAPELHETQKNQQLAAAIRGTTVPLPAPRLHVEPDDERAALAVLRVHGLTPGRFWVCCVGYTAQYAGRQWPAARWAEVLSAAIARHSRQCLFIGTADEDQTTEQIRGLMGAAAASTLSICAAPLPLNVLAGVMAHSAGYIGRDTGAMHLAAAVGIPVVTPFGGGHWPRFTPAAAGGGVVTLDVPCTGCDWMCPFTEAHCVSQIPAAAITAAIERMVSRPNQGFTTERLQPEAALLQQMTGEAAATAHALRRTLGIRTRALDATAGTMEALALATAHEAQLRAAMDERAREAAALAATRNAERHTLLDIVDDLRTVNEALEQTLAEARTTNSTLAGERDAMQAAHRVERAALVDAHRVERAALVDAHQAQSDAWQAAHTAERATLLESIASVTEAHRIAQAQVDAQAHALRQYERSLVRAVPAVVRRLRAARGHRLAELRVLVHEAAPVLRRKLGLKQR